MVSYIIVQYFSASVDIYARGIVTYPDPLNHSTHPISLFLDLYLLSVARNRIFSLKWRYYGP